MHQVDQTTNGYFNCDNMNIVANSIHFWSLDVIINSDI